MKPFALFAMTALALVLSTTGCRQQTKCDPALTRCGESEVSDTALPNCTPEGEPLSGDVRIECAPGERAQDGLCDATVAPTVRVTLSCDDYAGQGWQVLSQVETQCETDEGAACCRCAFDRDAVCDPCVVND